MHAGLFLHIKILHHLGLSGGAITGIVIGSLFGVFIIVLAVIGIVGILYHSIKCCCRRCECYDFD